MYVAIMYKCNKERFKHLDFFLYRESLKNANSNYANFQKVQLKFNFFELHGNTEGFLDMRTQVMLVLFMQLPFNSICSILHLLCEYILKNQNEHI